MKFNNAKEIKDFLELIKDCKGNIYLRSAKGDCYNLRSEFSKYIAMEVLLKERSNELEIFCDDRIDEINILSFFYNKDN